MNRLSNSVIGKFWNELSFTSAAIFIFFCISMTMQLIIAKFEEKSLLSSIQFGFDVDASKFIDEQRILYGNFSYEQVYFVLDVLFMLSLWLIVYLIYKKLKQKRYKKYVSYNIFYWLLTIASIVSVVLDLYENQQYLNDVGAFLPYIHSIETYKVGAITILLALTILYSLLHFSDLGIDNNEAEEDLLLDWNSKKVIVVLKGSIISILLLVAIGFGLTLLDQGATLVVHLLDEVQDGIPGKLQIIMTVVLINLLAVIISHYPEYFQSALDPQKKVRWHTNKIFGKIPSLITYTYNHSYDDGNTEKESKQAKEKIQNPYYGSYVTLFRYYLGVLTYVAWFYVVYRAFDLYSLTNWNASPAVFLWSTLVCVIIYYLYRAHSTDSSEIMQEFKELRKLNPSKAQKFTISANAILKVRPWLKAYVFLFVVTVGIGLWSMYIFSKYGWHLKSFNATILFLLSNTFLYVMFRFTRQYQKLAWFDGDRVKRLLNRDKESSFLKESKIEIELEHKFKSNLFHNIVGSVSSNYWFLGAICLFTFLSMFYLGCSYFAMRTSITSFSSIPLTLSFLMIAYISIIYPIKYYLANATRKYNEHNEASEDDYFVRKKKFLWIASIVFGCIFLLNQFGKRENLHKMFYVEADETTSIEEFTIKLDSFIVKNLVEDCTVTPMINITSFGGGLKSNLWTLLTMDALNDSIKSIKKDRRILDYTISLSGVSGGAVGLGNYLFLDYMGRINNNKYLKDTIIKHIGQENILAIDVSGIFGHDRFKQIITSGAGMNNPNEDRSYYAMQRYISRLTAGNHEMANTVSHSSISKFWNKMYQGVSHNPALIINTASTGYQPGVSLSLEYDTIVFPGYIHLSNFNDPNKSEFKDLKYYDAISTSNRFPIMSPAGEIENAGFFLDGGYFENSGLMTSRQFNTVIKNESEFLNNYPVGTVVLLNSKSDYIRQFISLNKIRQTKIKGSSNAAAIISGITNIDKLPNVLLATEETYNYENDFLFKIYLPHPITIDDIESSLGGEFEITQDIHDALKVNNAKVKNALEAHDINIEAYGVVVPPLARTLSSPAVEYQRAMVTHHEDVIIELQSVVNYIMTGVKNELKKEPCDENPEYVEDAPIKQKTIAREMLMNLPRKEIIKKTSQKNSPKFLKRN